MARHGARRLPVQRAAPAISPAKRAPSRVRPASTGVQTVRPANRTATRIVLPEVAHQPARPASVGAGLLRVAWQRLHSAQTAPLVRPINFGAELHSGVCRTMNTVALLVARQQEEQLLDQTTETGNKKHGHLMMGRNHHTFWLGATRNILTIFHQ